MNEQELERTIQEAQRGTREALEGTFKWFLDQKQYIRYAYRLLKDWEDAHDVIQESALKIYRKIRQYNPRKGTFVNWCYTIVINTARDALRRKVREKKMLDNSEDSVVKIPSPPFQGPERALERKELRFIIEEAEENAGLSLREREVWSLSQVEEDNETIAEILCRKKRSVEQAKYKARKKMEEYLLTHYPSEVEDFRR